MGSSSALSPTRRQLLALIASAASGPLRAGPRARVRAVAFDAFVLFSPQVVIRSAREVAGDKGDALFTAASAKLFGYTWYYTSAKRYAEFDKLAADAFASAGQGLGVALGSGDVDRMVEAYSRLELWPDVPAALQALRRRGVRLAMLSNLSGQALKANLRAGEIEEHFEFVLSTDQAQQYKPSPKAYDLAVRAFRIPRNEIGFAASASWDASGATWFGFPTAWVNRNGLPAEMAHVAPAIISREISGVLQLAGVQPT